MDPEADPTATREIEALRARVAELERRARESQALQEASLVFGRVLDPRVAGQAVLEVLEHLLRYQRGSIWLIGATGQDLDLVAHHSMGLTSDALTAELDRVRGLVRLGHGICGWVAQHGTAIRTGDVRCEPRYVEADPGTRSELCVPLAVGGRTIGSINVESFEADAFTEDDERLLNAVAAQAAVTIENARLYEQVKQAHQELERTQGELLQIQKMEAVGRLAGGIAHDFNNLLTVIIGRSHLVGQRAGSDERLFRDVELIRKTAERAGALTQQLLAFSSKQTLQPRVLDLNAVLGTLEPMLRRLLGEHLELVTRTTPALPPVTADRGQLEQVLLNLALNARDAMLRGGQLTLETGEADVDQALATQHPGTRPGRYVVLAVSDTGIGMDLATQARIFDPFFTTKEVGRGTGLGLSTVYGIVRQHQGFVTVDSEPGRGSTFRVFLPRAEGTAESPESADSSRVAAGGSETILLVEDEGDVRDLAREILQQLGYTVLDAQDPKEALQIARCHPGPIHLLATDIVMPRMSGPQLAERLGPAHPDMKVLYISGYTDDAIGQQGVLEEGSTLLGKPFTPGGLARQVRAVLDARARRPRTR